MPFREHWSGGTGSLLSYGSFSGQARVSGGALSLTGDPGVGKTALLNVLADYASASGTMVLRVVGGEFEAEISFAGLRTRRCSRCSATSASSAPPTGLPWA